MSAGSHDEPGVYEPFTAVARQAGKRNYRDHPGRVCPTGEHVVFSECDCIEEDEILGDTEAETDTSVEDQGMIVDPEEVLDALVEKASKPTLAMLFQMGKDKGLIAPVAGYGGEGTGA